MFFKQASDRYSQCAVSCELQLNSIFHIPSSSQIDGLMSRRFAGHVDLLVDPRAHLTCSLLCNRRPRESVTDSSD